MTKELKARVDKGVELYLAEKAEVVIVSGSHTALNPEMTKYNEAQVMAAYIRRKYGEGIAVLEEGESDSIQTNLLMVRKRAPKLRRFVVVSAIEVEERVRQCTEAYFPRWVKFAFAGCPEPGILPEREAKLRGDFDCITRNYAKMKRGDSQAYKKLLGKNGLPIWAELRDKHHKTCPYNLKKLPHPGFEA